MPEEPETSARAPGLLRRTAAGAWHVPAGFAFLLRHPSLWPLAALPTLLAAVLLLAGLVLGAFLGPTVQARFAPSPGEVPDWIGLPISLLLWVATLGAGMFLGLGLAFLLAAPILDQLSRRVEARIRGEVQDRGRGLRWEVLESLRGALYFLVAAPGVFLLGLVPLLGPLLALLWGARALAFQLTDPPLTRRGLSFQDKRRWHRRWLPEGEGFGLAGMIALLVPLANLLLAPSLAAGGTLLVLDLEELSPSTGAPAGPSAEAPAAEA